LHLSHRFRVLEVRVDGRHHHPRLYGDEVDAHQRDADPCVDHDALVEHAIEDVDETGSTGCSFNWHESLLRCATFHCPAPPPCAWRPACGGSRIRPYARAAAPAPAIAPSPARAGCGLVPGGGRSATSPGRSLALYRSSRR